MRIAIITSGTRGDVQPYIALGKGLQAVGHSVQILTYDSFEESTRSNGLDFISIGGDIQALLARVRQNVKGNLVPNQFSMIRELAKHAGPLMRERMERCWQATENVDLLIVHVPGTFYGVPIAEKRGIPIIAAYLQPITPTTTVHGGILTPPSPDWLSPLQSFYNKATGMIQEEATWTFTARYIRPAVKDILHMSSVPNPLKQLRKQNALHLYGYSPSLHAKPQDWPATHHITGFWVLERSAEWQPSVSLQKFLQAGPPPVYVGFGSMGNRDPRRMTTLVVRVLQKSRQRGVLVTGWDGLKKGDHFSDDIFVLDEAPHDWLFPRMAAVVHHGGAGTTAAGLRAGVPNVIIPHINDQCMWGHFLYKQGIASKAINLGDLSVNSLVAAITTAVNDASVRQRAQAFGEKIRAEDGVGTAVRLIQAKLGL